MSVTSPFRIPCAHCGHLSVFHPEGGPCKTNRCRAKCQAFVPADPHAAVVLPPVASPEDLADALSKIMDVVENAPARNRPAAAAHLDRLIQTLPTLGKGARVRGPAGSIRTRLKTCLAPASAPQDAEVATHDDTEPGPD